MRTTCSLHMLLAVVLGLGIASHPGKAADTCADAKSKVNSIETFMDCLNTCLIAGGGPVDVSDAVQCLPNKCLITVTMSPQSAQRACTLGGCQLPRIVLDCPGPSDGLRFRPSFLMCPVDSKGAGGDFGKDRIEIGEDNMKLKPVRTTFGTSTFDMKMADVPIPPGKDWMDMQLADVISEPTKVKKGRPDPGSKNCNSCHDDNGPTAIQDMFGKTLMAELSLDISPFGVFSEALAPYVIGANGVIDRMRLTPPELSGQKGSDGKELTSVDVLKQGLSPICDCIKNPNNQKAIIADNQNKRNFPRSQSGRGLGDATPNPDIVTEIGVMTRLCDALNAYAKPPVPGNQGACGTTPGASCGGLVGGGKFLQFGAVSILSLSVQGNVVSDGANSFRFTDIDGDMSSFNYLTGTLIEPVYLSSLTGTLSGSGNLVVVGSGVAFVNGVSTNITLNAASVNGTVTFQIVDTGSGTVLAAGTGESGLASLQFLTGGP